MVSEKLKTFFGKVKKQLGGKLREIKLEDVAKFGAKAFASGIPVIGPIIKEAIDEFLPDEKEELLKELNELSESQFEEISEKVGASVQYLKDIQKFTLFTFDILQADHEVIKELIRELIEIQKRVEITIPTIQEVLEKDKKSKGEGEFFRDPPEWIDFEEGFVVERKEVDEIIQKLETDKIPNIQLVVGEPASGKTVILKNIGFELAKMGYDVYIIELKDRHSARIESYFNEAREINDERTFLIVDDAHLQLPWCTELIRDFDYKDLRTKLIIGSRDVKEVKKSLSEDYDFSTQKSSFEKLDRTEIHAIKAADLIISLFLKRQRSVSDKYQIKAVSRGFDEYKHDLWWLAWSLMVYDKENTVNKERIYSGIVNEIKRIKGEDVFLPLSAFYRFEIPVEKRFLTKTLEIDETLIDKLIGISKIQEINELRQRPMLALHHSSLASLYFETYQSTDLFPGLGEDVKERITEQSKDDGWERGLFYLYLKSEPTNLLDVLALADWEKIKEGLTLLEDNEIEESIKQLIEKEDLIAINGMVEYITNKSRVVASKFVNCIFDTLVSKIEEEKDIQKIGAFVRGIIESEIREAARRLVDDININALLSKIEKEEDIQKIGAFVRDIVRTGRIKRAEKLVDDINIDALLSKIEQEEDIEKIGAFVRDIDVASNEAARKLAEGVNINALLSKIEQEEDIQKIGAFVRDIVRTGRIDMARKLVDDINIDALLSKMEKEEDIEKIGAFVRDIVWTERKKVVREIVNSLNPKLREELHKTTWWTPIEAGIA